MRTHPVLRHQGVSTGPYTLAAKPLAFQPLIEHLLGSSAVSCEDTSGLKPRGTSRPDPAPGDTRAERVGGGSNCHRIVVCDEHIGARDGRGGLLDGYVTRD
jgi:hypothetical protein